MGKKEKLKPFRIVLDTNVILSALLFSSGRVNWLVDAWTAGQIVPLVSRESMIELTRVLMYPKFKLNEWERQAVLEALLPFVETIGVPEASHQSLFPYCRDRDDVKFLALAQAGQADFLVTGNADLLVVSNFETCRILTPEEFRQIFRSTDPERR